MAGFKRRTKYAPFIDYLEEQKADSVRVSFAKIEKILGFELPASARYPQWWSNNDFNSVFTKAWLRAGWRSKEVDVVDESITFFRPEDADEDDDETTILDLDR